MKRLLTTLAVFATVLAIAIPAGAVTKGGVPDGDEHPFVGLSIYFSDHDNDGGAITPELVSHRCSGTLLTPTVYITAGHCTDGMDTAMMWFIEDVQATQGLNGYPTFSDAGDIWFDAWGAPGVTVTGTPYTYPAYENPLPWFMADLGIVVLDQSVEDLFLYDGSEGYGELPSDLQFDDLARGRHTTFTAVGYGLQFSTGTTTPNGPTPSPFSAYKARMQANPWLLQVNTPGFTGPFSFLLSNNASTGGTCFGDSGGPNFFGDGKVIAGITSYGLNGSCGGTGGVFRLDHQPLLDWVNSFLP